MKSNRHIYNDMIKIENIKDAVLKGAAKGNKKKHKSVSKVVNHIDEYALKLHDKLVDHSIYIKPYEQEEITETREKHKKRQISKPGFLYDEMLQYVLLSKFAPYTEKYMYDHAYGSIKNKGTGQIWKTIEKWLKDKHDTKYCLTLDIHKCYPNVDQDLLISRIRERFPDKDFMIEMEKVIRACSRGLALGSPMSGHLLHFLLTPLDRWITEQDGVFKYARYADNFFIFSANKRKLGRVRDTLVQKLKDEYHMEFNHDYQLFRVSYIDVRTKKECGRPVDVCGTKFYRNRKILRKGNMIRTTRKAKKIAEKGNKTTWYDAQQIMSRLGFFRHHNMHNVFDKYVKPNVNIKKMRKLISNHSKQKARQQNIR